MVVRLPCTVPSLVTLTVKVQLVPAARLAPLSAIRLPPGSAVIVPPLQEPVKPFGVDTMSPAGSVSENASPSSVSVLFTFFSVNVKETEDLRGIAILPKPLLKIGGAVPEINCAVEVLPVPPFADITVTEFMYKPSGAV